MSKNIVILDDGYELDLNECLICKICHYYYPKDEQTKTCGICDYKIPMDHYGKCSVEPEVEEYDMGCFFNCDICKRYFCTNHVEKEGYTIFECKQQVNHYASICEDCVLNKKIGYYEYFHSDNVLKYINKLKAENARLQAMVDYQPGGKGFEEAKEHFEELVEKNEN